MPAGAEAQGAFGRARPAAEFPVRGSAGRGRDHAAEAAHAAAHGAEAHALRWREAVFRVDAGQGRLREGRLLRPAAAGDSGDGGILQPVPWL